MNITSNYHPRLLLNFDQLPAKWQKEFDWASVTDDFFYYKGSYYCLSEFTAARRPLAPYWHAAKADSFFSGILVRIEDDTDYVVVGRYCQ